MNYPPSKRKREEEEYYDSIAKAITPSPMVLALTYEAATNVESAYVKWSYNLTTPIEGYTRVKLASISLYNNYNTARWSSIGLQIDEINIRPTQAAQRRGPTWVVPNQTYNTTSIPSLFYQDVGSEIFFPLGSMGSICNLTITLYDGSAAVPVTATGTPAGFFADIKLIFTN